jgi:hypothetical protein
MHSKMAKHEAKWLNMRKCYLTFAFDIFDFLTSETVNRLKRVQMHSNVLSFRSMNVYFQ